VVRPPLVYGPGVRANFLRLMQLAGTGLPLPFASIRNRRSFLFVGNLVALLRRCAEHPAAAGRTFLVSDGEDLSTPELVRRMAAALGRKARLLPFPPALLPAKLAGSLVVDAADARERLGWQPPLSVNEALARTAAWYTLRR
jgi:nucleoside-diphosphate-sugar epimerase